MEHLLGIEDLSTGEIEHLLGQTDRFVEVSRRRLPKVPALQGRTVTWLFYEDSTRTRLSFEQAAKRLSADTLSFAVSSSSVRKGESLRDTVQTIEAMGVDAIVVRHSSAGVPAQITQWVTASVVNAGDGWHEHPTQALLDCYTIREHLGGVDGLRIAIVGDVKHSRVARSDVLAFTKLGAEVTLVAPPTLLPSSLEGWPVQVSHDLDSVLGAVDVVYLLRMQQERMTEALVPSLREYTSRYGLTRRRADRLGDKAIVMHPGPMNRGVEIAADVAGLPRAVVVDQVRNGVAVRMAVLYELLARPAGGTVDGLDAVLPTDAAPEGVDDDVTTEAAADEPGARPGVEDVADRSERDATGAADRERAR
jgi:aspartate carbamoyltransferase catalytic subunit